VRRRRLYRIGYAAQGQDTSFDREVRLSLARAAEREHIELIVVDNRYQPKIALRSADYLVREQVDLVIEFQTDELIAPAIASKYLEANIPFIAIDIPHPGATYFGANNYQAGLMAGHYMGRWAKKHWDGEVEEVLLIELLRAGSLPKARMRGLAAGIGEVIRLPATCRTVSIDGDGQFQTCLERVRKYLRESKSKRILIGAANDSSALGALRAFEEAGRAAECAIVGQNGEPEARAELRMPHTRLVASVAYFPEKYGDGLLRLALDILARKVARRQCSRRTRSSLRTTSITSTPTTVCWRRRGRKIGWQAAPPAPPTPGRRLPSTWRIARQAVHRARVRKACP